MHTRESLIQRYRERKEALGGAVPEYRDFLNAVGISKRAMDKHFGAAPYAKLQAAAGDSPNQLRMERTPTDRIMRQYGALVVELGSVPVSADWTHRGLKPSVSGLAKKPHSMKWSELPSRFVEWVAAHNASEFASAVAIIKNAGPAMATDRGDQDFSRLVATIRDWSPARRRSAEEAYKVELRKHLEALRYELKEESGESTCDLVVGRGYAIELKKDPSLAEYDRLFGQLARHLQHQRCAIALVLDTRDDAYASFARLVDRYFNTGGHLVEVLKKG